MAIEPLNQEQIDENFNTLTDLFESYRKTDYDFIREHPSQFPNWPMVIKFAKTAIPIVAKYGNTVTWSEIVEAEKLEVASAHSPAKHVQLAAAISVIHSLWIDVDAVVGRPDNLLKSWIEPAANWEDDYKRSVAQIVVSNGKLVSLTPSYYGWEEERRLIKREPIVAAFNLIEEEWDEFENTYATDEDSHTGFTVDVLYSDGNFRKFRYETDIAEMAREFSKINPK